MNQLGFPLRILERGEDDICILVSHEPGNSYDKDRRERAAHTKTFCDWLRRQFPQVLTEFRYVNTKQVRIRGGNAWSYHRRYRTAGCDKHFVAYGLTRAQLMFVKLAWQFQSQPVRLADFPIYDGSFTIMLPGGLRPSDALNRRLKAKAEAKVKACQSA
jgi:hypothetical protein